MSFPFRTRLACWALAPGLFLASSLQAQTLPDAAAVARYAEQLLDAQRIGEHEPGLSLLVARGDEVLVRAARGAANVEFGVPLKPEHPMRLGSVTKQFAAAALLRLIDEGKASLDDPLSRFLPDYPNGQSIQLRHLLNHTSGVRSYTSLPNYMGNPVRRDLDTAGLIAEFKDQAPDFKPGERWAYSNSGYVLVGAVIEAITHEPWHAAVQRLLAPAQITVHYPAPDRLIPQQAYGYTRGPQGLAPAGLISMTQPHAAGALVANTEALWGWNRLLHEQGLLKPASYRPMTTPEGAAAAQHYGFGIGTAQVRGMPLLQHGGGIHGFQTTLHYLPQQRITVALLRNSDAGGVNLDAMARRLEAFAAGRPYPEPQPVAMDAAALKAFEGLFGPDAENARTLRVHEGRLTVGRAGGRTQALTPLGGDRFAVGDGVAQLHFDRGADGRLQGARLYDDGDELGGAPARWTRQGDLPTRPEVALSDAQRQALIGQYQGERLSVKVFQDASGQLRGQAPGQPLFTLRAAGPRELYLLEVDASLHFSPADGPAQSVTLHQGKARVEMRRVP